MSYAFLKDIYCDHSNKIKINRSTNQCRKCGINLCSHPEEFLEIIYPDYNLGFCRKNKNNYNCLPYKGYTKFICRLCQEVIESTPDPNIVWN